MRIRIDYRSADRRYYGSLLDQGGRTAWTSPPCLTASAALAEARREMGRRSAPHTSRGEPAKGD